MRQKSALSIAAAVMAVLLLARAGLSAEPADPNKDKELAAQKAAEAWLSGVDKGGYAASWDQASPAFQQSIKKDVWVNLLEQMRKPLGAVKSRAFKGASYALDPQGAPKGEYVSIQFDTTYKNRGLSVETVTPRLDDGKWRISGYFIK